MPNNHERITKEFCQGKTLVFSPKRAWEANFIQRRLQEMGFSWGGRVDKVPPKICIKCGILVKDGKLSINPDLNKHPDALLCTTQQLRADYAPAQGPTQSQGTSLVKILLGGQMNTQFGQAADVQRQPIGSGQPNEKLIKESDREMEAMIGLDQPKEALEQYIANKEANQIREGMGLTVEQSCRHMVFTGPSGTGKTTFARAAARRLHAYGLLEQPKAVEVTRKNVVGEFIGQTAKMMDKKITEAQGGVLFIDEAYALSRDNGLNDSKRDFGHEAIETLVADMENGRDNFILIVAGYPGPMQKFIDSNEGLKSRFAANVSFPNYSMEELSQIMDKKLQQNDFTMTQGARDLALQKLKEERGRAGDSFGNGREVRRLVEQAKDAMDLRLKKEGLLTGTHAKDEAYVKAISTLTPADIEKVSLAGIASQEKPAATSGATIGFGAKQIKKTKLVTGSIG